jgi:hypothetical protein
MDLVAAHRHRGRSLGSGGIIGIAVGQAPAARVVHRLAAQFGDQRALALERREDLARDDRGRLGYAIVGQIGRLKLGGKARHHHSLVGRRLEQGAQLLQRRVEDIVRREHAACGIGPLLLGAVVERFGKGGEPREIGIRLARIAHADLRLEEVGHVAIWTGQLAQHIGREPAEAAAIGEALRTGQGAGQLIADHFVIERRRWRQALRAERAQLGEFCLGTRQVPGPPACGPIV